MKTSNRYQDYIRILSQEEPAHRFAPQISGRWGNAGHSKLCATSVLAIRKWSDNHTHLTKQARAKKLAPIFHVSPMTIHDVITFSSWQRVVDPLKAGR